MAQIIAGGTKPNSGGNVEVITQTQTTTWAQLQGKPYIAVSSKGIFNGLSTIPNDGADFGPDTTLGATAPGQYGSPYTKTTGIQDAQNYCSDGGHIVLGNGDFYIYDTVTISNDNIVISGAGLQGYEAGELSAESGTRIVLGDNVNKNMINVTGSRYIFENFVINGNSPNNTTTGLYGIYAGTSNLGMDLHLRTVYVIQVNGIGVYSNSGFYTETLITEGNSSWGLYLDGQGGWLVDGYLSYADIGGAYLGCNGVTISNITISGGAGVASTLPAIEVAGNNNNITNLNIIRNTTSSAPPSPLIVSGGFNNISGIYLNYSGSNMTTVPPNITVSGPVNLISGIYTENTYSSAFISMSGGYNKISNIAAHVDNNTSVIVDTSNYNVFSDMYLFGPPTGTAFSLPSTDVIKNIIMINASTNAIIPLVPTLSANPPVSGTVYQNTNPYDIRLKIPVTYSPTSTAAATLATGISSTSTVTTSTKVSIPAGLTAADGEILTYEMVVPAGWYYELVATNATIGTVEVQAA